MATQGRPTKYRKAMCKKVKDLLAQGYSTRCVAGLMKINENTLYDWKKKYPDFSKSIDEGRALGEQWYLDRAQDMIAGKKGNHNALIFMMKNIYRYSDNPTEATESKPININFTIKEEPEE